MFANRTGPIAESVGGIQPNARTAEVCFSFDVMCGDRLKLRVCFRGSVDRGGDATAFFCTDAVSKGNGFCEKTWRPEVG
jgi:hypothetical protein